MGLDIQCSSVAQSCLTLCNPMNRSRPPYPSPIPGGHQSSCPLSRWCHPAISTLLLLPSIFTSMRVFSNGSVLRIRLPKYWSFSLSISRSNEYSGLISFRMDWLNLPAVQGLPRVFSNTTVQKHQFFGTQPSLMVQLSHPFMTAGKTIALIRQTFVGKVMSLVFNILSKLSIAFLPRSECLLISWLQSPSSVILEPQK